MRTMRRRFKMKNAKRNCLNKTSHFTNMKNNCAYTFGILYRITKKYFQKLARVKTTFFSISESQNIFVWSILNPITVSEILYWFSNNAMNIFSCIQILFFIDFLLFWSLEFLSYGSFANVLCCRWLLFIENIRIFVWTSVNRFVSVWRHTKRFEFVNPGGICF